jgi:hypothetical protein
MIDFLNEDFILDVIKITISNNSIVPYFHIAIINKNINNESAILLRHVYDLHDDTILQIILDYVKTANLATYSSFKFSKNGLLIVYFNNVNPKLLLELI